MFFLAPFEEFMKIHKNRDPQDYCKTLAISLGVIAGSDEVLVLGMVVFSSTVSSITAAANNLKDINACGTQLE